jgi:hypothetical protein
MSYRLNEGDVVATSSYNGRFYTTSTESKAVERQPEELLAWALLELAVDDTTILARYGLFTREGELRAWPRRETNRDGYVRWEPIIIANMKDPLDHARLREFWLDPTQGQHWCDLIGCKLPAKDIWNGILKHHAK